MIDTNNKDNIRQNQTFVHWMHADDSTNMITNDFDRYTLWIHYLLQIKLLLAYLNNFL